jgi:hypothetical protein
MANPAFIAFKNGGTVKGSDGKHEYQVSAQGRNGYMKQSGVEVFKSPFGVLRISPVNSKGTVGNCCIEVPSDPETLNKFIKALLEAAKED